MSVVVTLLDGPITPDREAAVLARGPAGASDATHSGATPPETIGATLRFQGIVRRQEDGRDLVALDYTTYYPMAERELASLARDVMAKHGLASIEVLHSRGRVAVGEVSFVLTVSAAHRAPAIAALAEFIDRMKRDVPIWKSAVWAS